MSETINIPRDTTLQEIRDALRANVSARAQELTSPF